jgi:hypothetical protein
VDELVDELAVAFFPAAPVAATAFAFTCHGVFRSLIVRLEKAKSVQPV